MRKFICKKDIVIVLCLFVLSLAVFCAYVTVKSGEKSTAVIIADDTEICRIDLESAQNGRFSLPEKPSVAFEIKDKKIAFANSDCPCKVCVNSGFIGISGQTAVCLPNKTAIKIEGK